MRKTGSIKRNLIIVVMVGTLIPILALIIISGSNFNEYSIKAAKSEALSLANEYSHNIEKQLDEVFISVNILADMPSNMLENLGTSAFSYLEIHNIQRKLIEKNKQTPIVYTILLPGRIIDPVTNELNDNLVLLSDILSDGKYSHLDDWKYSFKLSVIGDTAYQTNILALNTLTDILNKPIDFFKIDNYKPVIEEKPIQTCKIVPEEKVIENVSLEKPKIKNDIGEFSFNLDTEGSKDNEFLKI